MSDTSLKWYFFIVDGNIFEISYFGREHDKLSTGKNCKRVDVKA